MKRTLVALVLALGVATVVGCGSGSPTNKPAPAGGTTPSGKN